MNYESIGKLIEKGDTQVISDAYNKRTFVIQPDGDYDKPIQFEIFGKVDSGDKPQKVLMLDRFQIGEEVKVMFSISSNFWEGGGKWFTKCDAFAVHPAQQGQMAGAPPAPYQQPAPTATYPPVPNPNESMPDEEVPF